MNNSDRTGIKKKMTTRQLIIVGAALAGIGIAAVFATGSINNPWAGPATAEATSQQATVGSTQTILPVNVQQVQFVESIQQFRDYTGTIRARRRSELAFEMPGKIGQVLVDEGDRVEAGAVIATMDTATLKAQQSAILAQLAQSESVMNELTAGPRAEKIAAAKANVVAAESEFENAELRLKRRQGLIDVKAIPIEEFQQAKSDVKTTRARLNSVREGLAELEAGTRKEKVSAQAATVRQLEASAKEMEVAIGKSTLLAPFAATVTRRFVDPGSIVQPSVAVVRLVEQDKLEAWIGLPFEVASQIKIGETYVVIVGKQSYSVVASAKIGELDTATRTQTVLFNLDATAADSVVSGQLCQIQISTEVDTSGVWIPNSALARGIRGLSGVLTLEPEEGREGLFRVRKRDIEVIKTDSNRVLAKGTIRDGDRIVVNGVHRITEGQLVSIAQEILRP